VVEAAEEAVPAVVNARLSKSKIRLALISQFDSGEGLLACINIRSGKIHSWPKAVF